MRRYRLSILIGYFLLALGYPALGGETDVKKTKKPLQNTRSEHRVIYNLDCTEFFVGTFGPVVPKTLDKFVDDHAAAGVTDLFINVNAQRTNYRSDVWEAWWDGYDPSLGDDQPFFSGLDLEAGRPSERHRLHLVEACRPRPYPSCRIITSRGRPTPYLRRAGIRCERWL